ALASVLTEREKAQRLGDVYLPRAERVRATVEFAYRRGGLSVLDLLDAQRTYRETALEHVRALGNYWNAVYQLEAAVGERRWSPDVLGIVLTGGALIFAGCTDASSGAGRPPVSRA